MLILRKILDGVGQSAILTGVVFLTIVIAVPETRFQRQKAHVATSAMHETKDHVEEGVREFNSSEASDHTISHRLKPWSGIDTDTSLFGNFLRPFPLALYPACAYAVLSCKFSRHIIACFSDCVQSQSHLRQPSYFLPYQASCSRHLHIISRQARLGLSVSLASVSQPHATSI